MSVFITIGIAKTALAETTASNASSTSYSGCNDHTAATRESYDWAKTNAPTGDCCPGSDTGTLTSSCFHWIEGTGSKFADALANAANSADGWNSSTYDTSAANKCKEDEDLVVWVGREFSNGKSVFTNNPPVGGGFDNKISSKSSLSSAAKDLISDGINELDTTEEALGFVCESMFQEQVGDITPYDFDQSTCALNENLYVGERYGNSGSVSLMYHDRTDETGSGDSTYKTTANGKPNENGYSSGRSLSYVTYARPGDHIQFQNKYCYGAQGVWGDTPTGQTAKISTTQNDNSNGSGKLTDLTNWSLDESYDQDSDDIESGKTQTSTNATLRDNDAGTNINSEFKFKSVRSWLKHTTTLAAGNSSTAQKDAGYPWACGNDNSFTASSTTTLSSWSDATSVSYHYYEPGSRNSTYYGKFKWKCKGGSKFANDVTGEVHKWKKKPAPNGSLGAKIKDEDDIEYEVKNSTKANVDTNMTAVIPYNFDTSVSAALGDGTGTVGAGEGVNLKYTVDLLTRINTDVDGDTAYRTWTPNYTKVQAIRFTIPSNAADYDPNFDSKLSGAITSDYASACAYYAARLSTMNIGCNSLYHYDTEDADIAASNPNHNLGAADGMTATGILTEPSNQYTFRDMAVPDDPGAKFCVALAVYPADSHDLANDFSGDHANDSTGLTVPTGRNALTGVTYNGQYNKTSPKWRISGATCATIAKKSNFQIWGSTYTNSGADTLLSRKRYSEEHPGTYGSFADGAIVAKQNVARMASASVLGYTNTLSYYGGYGGNSDTAYCDSLNSWTPGISLSSLIVGKADYCENNEDEVHPAATNTIKDNSTNYRNLLKDRFVDSSQTACGTISLSNWTSIVNSTCTKKKVYAPATAGSVERAYYRVKASTVNLGSADKNSASATANAGSLLKDADHNARITSSIEIPAYATLIIQADTINIIGNICYGASASNSNGCAVSASNYSLNAKTIIKDRNTTSYANISQLPQALLFANNSINIRKEVYQVDSWLITDGAVKTCDWDPGTRTIDEYGSDGNVIGTKQISDEKAEDCARLLMINGPVLSNSTVLRRSGGSFSNTMSLSGIDAANGTGKGYENNLGLNGSVTPAEILNLRPDVYMWSYWQAQQYTQAVSSYTRELAPRL